MTARAPFPIEMLDPTEMSRADALTSRRLPGAALMERAGEAIASAALAILGDRAHVIVLCGPGNNGGDGYVAARLLEEAGRDVLVASLGDVASLKGDAAWAAALWIGDVVDAATVDVEGTDLVIDALFGAGLSRDIDGAAREVIERTNAAAEAQGLRVLAVDMPSGVDGASGAVRGIAIRATDTVTFFRLKPGHALMPGRALCGTLTLADIGIAADVLDTIAPKTSLNAPPLWQPAFPRPTLGGHKYSRGHALVLSGPLARTGAARLCARGALRAGAGLVTIATPREALAVHAAALTAIMIAVADDGAGLAAILAYPRLNAIGLGPGLGVCATTREKVRIALAPTAADSPARSVVLDADALSSFADSPRDLFTLIERSGHAVVLTPHDGEFAKLFGSVLDVSQPKPNRTREAARLSGAVVVLKGPDTTVAAPDGRAAIAMSDAPWLATAGSGDVLAGIVTGLLAQNMPVFEAAAAAVWMHAEAARDFGPGLISEDIPDAVPRVLRMILKSQVDAS